MLADILRKATEKISTDSPENVVESISSNDTCQSATILKTESTTNVF